MSENTQIPTLSINKTQQRLYAASSDPTFEHATYKAMEEYLKNPTAYFGQLLYCKANDTHYKIAKGENDQKILKEQFDTVDMTEYDSKLDKFSEQLDNKTNKNETQNIQQQVNNLVLGAVGDGNNAEVVQARGEYSVLNDRVNANDAIRSNLKLTNNEIASCFDFSENLWLHGDVFINFAEGDTWKYKDISVGGLTPEEKYVLTLDKPINHINANYIIELLIDGKSKCISFSDIPYTFTAKANVVLRFQTLTDVKATYTGTATYTGITIRKSLITIKDRAILKEYSVRDLKGIDDIFDIPTTLINENLSKVGGINKYENITLEFNAKENTDYYVSYDEVVGNRLPKDTPIIIYQCLDSEGHNLSGNVNLLYVDGEKEKFFTTPNNTATIKIIFMITHELSFDNSSMVTWRGVNVVEGKSPTIMIQKEVIPDINTDKVIGLEEVLNTPYYLVNDGNVEATGGINSWTNKKVSYAVEELQNYTLSYKELTGSRLMNGEATIIYRCINSKTGEITRNNTNLLYVGQDKQATLHTPSGTTTLEIMFVVTLGDTFGENFVVQWTGLKLYKGITERITIKKEAIPEDLIPSIPPIPGELFDFFELHLPSHIYVAVGYPLEIYNHTLCRCINIDNYVFEWLLPKGGGRSFKDKILISPPDTLSGTTDILTLNVYNKNYKLICSKTSVVHYIKPTALLSPNVLRKILCIGDSLTDIDTWRKELYNRFSKDIESGKIEYLGTLGTAPYFHEGHSGWSLNSYLNDSSEGWNGNYKIKVTVAPNISPKKQYKFGSKVFEYEKTEIENGSIWVYFNRISGEGFVTTSDSPCREIDNAISGDVSISFIDCKITSFNPFYNNGFDCLHYSKTHLKGVIPNDVIMWLGTNGGSPDMNLKSVSDSVQDQISKYSRIINNIIKNWPNTKIFLCYLHYRPDQNGQGYTSGTTNSKAWDSYVFEFNKQLHETFKDHTNIVFVPVGQTFDRVNNYPNRQIDINTRNTTKISVAGDTVHMDKSTGFLQVADTIYGAYVNNI